MTRHLPLSVRVPIESEYLPKRRNLYQMRNVQRGMYQCDRRSWDLYPGGDGRKGYLYPLWTVRQRLSAGEHHGGV